MKAKFLNNRGPTVLTVTIVMTCLSTVFVALRLISRAGIVKRLSKDDYAMMVAWIISFGFSFSICYGTAVGLGRHETAILLAHRLPLRKAEYVFSVLYNPALMATKTSICLFYLSLSRNHPMFKWMTIGTLAVVNVAGTALTFLNIFQCHPVTAAFVGLKAPGANCIDIVTIFLSSAPVNISTDLALLFLPMPILTAMRLPRNEKIILVITFSFGAFVTVVDVIRIAYLQSAALSRLQDHDSFLTSDPADDYSWVASLSFMWSAIEVHVGMICACVPGVKPLAAKVFPALLGRRRGTITSDNSSAQITHGPECMAGDQQNRQSTLFRGVNPDQEASCEPSGQDFPTGFHGTHGHHQEKTGERDDYDDDDLLQHTRRIRSNSTEQRRLTLIQRATNPSARKSSVTLFDFVAMKHPRSMVKMTTVESIPHLAFVTILFFLWGFAYGLLDNLNTQFQTVVGVSTSQAVGLRSTYYAAYLIGPLTIGQYVLRNHGFKKTFIVGLCLYGVGTLVFWPSAVLASYAAFVVSTFIIGLGVSTLEVGGNPFIILCGPPEHAETRLTISQGVQAIGTVVSPLLAEKVLFRNVSDAPSLIDVQWTYLGIALFDVALAVLFHYMPVPEATDDELEELAARRSAINHKLIKLSPPGLKMSWTVCVTSLTLALGIFAQFCYVGAQEAVAFNFQALINTTATVTGLSSALPPFDFLTIGHAAFAVGRFCTAALTVFIRPRHVLLVLFIGAIITNSLTLALPQSIAITSIPTTLILTIFFESGIFSIVFAISMRGLGRATKWGSALMAASISGGAFIPGIMILVTRMPSRGLRGSFAVVIAVFAFATIFPLYLEFSSKAKAQVDPVPGPSSDIILGSDNVADSAAEKKLTGLRHWFLGNKFWHRHEMAEVTVGPEDNDEKSKDTSKGTAIQVEGRPSLAIEENKSL